MKGDGGEKDVNRIIRIVMLASIIAVTLGMTNLSTTLAKGGFVAAVTVSCQYGGYWGVVNVDFYKITGSKTTPLLPYTFAVKCTSIGSTTATTEPMQKPDSWHVLLFTETPGYGSWDCATAIDGQGFPMTSSLVCTSPSDGNYRSVVVQISEA
jgi:hypothetical protein